MLFLEHRELLALKGPVPEEDYEIQFGRASVVREGTDVTVVALAMMVHRSLKACEDAGARGISVELIDPAHHRAAGYRHHPGIGRARPGGSDRGRGIRTLRLRRRDRGTDRRRGFDDLDAPIRRLNGVHTPTPYSPPLEAAVVPSADRDRPGHPRP